jgi:glutamate carboxypeptidase
MTRYRGIAPGALFALVAVLVASSGTAGPLTQEERRIAAWVDAHAEEAVALLERTVNINSGTMNHEGVRAVGRLFEVELSALGFETRWIAMPEEIRRAGHLFAERRGEHGQRVLLIGHLDTVFERESPFQRFARQGDTATGPGTEDMKGGNVVIVYALKALHSMGALDGTTITVALTGDEEKPGRPLSISRRHLSEAGRESDVALGFEAGVRDIGTATVARRGASGWSLRTTATPAHSSQIFDESYGAGAIFETARILAAFYERLRGERYLTFNPGVILGGTEITYDGQNNRGTAFGKTNIIAETAVVDGDLRFISGEQKERARAAMRSIVADSHPKASAEIRFSDGYPAMEPSPGNFALLARFDEVSRDLGYGQVEALDPGERGAADVSFVAAWVDALDGLGPVGSGGHTIDEQIDLRTLPIATKRAAVLIYRLTR